MMQCTDGLHMNVFSTGLSGDAASLAVNKYAFTFLPILLIFLYFTKSTYRRLNLSMIKPDKTPVPTFEYA